MRVAPDEGARCRGQVAAHRLARGANGCRSRAGRSRRHGAQRRVLVQHLLLEALQLRAGVDAQLVGEQTTHPGTGGQRVGLPPRPVQVGDEQRPQPLTQGVCGDEVLELGDQLARRPQVGPGGQALLDQPEPGLRQAQPVRVRPGGVPGAGQQLAAEERQRPVAELEHPGRVLRPAQGGGLVGQAQDADGIHVLRVDGEGVAGLPAAHQGRVAERPAQA